VPVCSRLPSWLSWEALRSPYLRRRLRLPVSQPGRRRQPPRLWAHRAMTGDGGISVVLIHKGTTYCYCCDDDEFRWSDAVRESDRIGPCCQ